MPKELLPAPAADDHPAIGAFPATGVARSQSSRARRTMQQTCLACKSFQNAALQDLSTLSLAKRMCAWQLITCLVLCHLGVWRQTG
jgi:hypothetical protein